MLHLSPEEKALREKIQSRKHALDWYNRNKQTLKTDENKERLSTNSKNYYKKNKEEINRKQREKYAEKKRLKLLQVAEAKI